jgi:hypothetical protein
MIEWKQIGDCWHLFEDGRPYRTNLRPPRDTNLVIVDTRPPNIPGHAFGHQFRHCPVR